MYIVYSGKSYSCHTNQLVFSPNFSLNTTRHIHKHVHVPLYVHLYTCVYYNTHGIINVYLPPPLCSAEGSLVRLSLQNLRITGTYNIYMYMYIYIVYVYAITLLRDVLTHDYEGQSCHLIIARLCKICTMYIAG